MTVKELISRLERYEPDEEVFVSGYGKLSLAQGIDYGTDGQGVRIRNVELFAEGEEP